MSCFVPFSSDKREEFDEIYTSSPLSGSRVYPLTTQWQARLFDEERVSIRGEASKEETKSAIWSLKAFKAPGLNGLHARFFQRFWLSMGD